MPESMDQKYIRAAEVVCRQGLVPFPVNDTTVTILKNVIEDDEEELDFICAFAEKPSQTLPELKESTRLSEEKINQLTTNLGRVEFRRPEQQK